MSSRCCGEAGGFGLPQSLSLSISLSLSRAVPICAATHHSFTSELACLIERIVFIFMVCLLQVSLCRAPQVASPECACSAVSSSDFWGPPGALLKPWLLSRPWVERAWLALAAEQVQGPKHISISILWAYPYLLIIRRLYGMLMCFLGALQVSSS